MKTGWEGTSLNMADSQSILHQQIVPSPSDFEDTSLLESPFASLFLVRQPGVRVSYAVSQQISVPVASHVVSQL